MHDLPLGRSVAYPDRYAPEVLVGIPRAEARRALGVDGDLPFRGVDLWTAWELTWLDDAGKPISAVADISVPAESISIVESKSLKLYLGSYAMHSFSSGADVQARIEDDVRAIVGIPVDVRLSAADGTGRGFLPPSGDCIDALEVSCDRYDVDAGLLEIDRSTIERQVALYSHQLRSLCPVTGQPDYATVLLRYSGPKIRLSGLLRYIVSYRQHQDFHEACVERMFCDIMERCECSELAVTARYTRRGGIDINPHRSTNSDSPLGSRVWRQ